MPNSQNKSASRFSLLVNQITRPGVAALASLLAGCLLALSYAPIGAWPLTFISLIALFIIWRESTPRQGFQRGCLFGLGLFGMGISWVYVTMNEFGNMAPPLAGFATFLFVFFFSLYTGVLGYAQARWLKSAGAPAYFVFLLPVSWVLMEWLKGWLFTGFPWLDLGYAQVDTYLAHYAPWLGIYGVSLAVLMTAGAMSYLLLDVKKHASLSLAVISVVWIGAWGLGFVSWGADSGKPLRVALVQINVPIKHKWQPAYRSKIVQDYVDHTDRAGDAELVIWPEGALPMMLDSADKQLEEYFQYLASRGVGLVFGVVEPDTDAESGRYYNSVALRGAHQGIYRKQHLVPFGEYPPIKPVFSWLLSIMRIPMSDFSRGNIGQAALGAGGQKLGISICYENIFASEMRQWIPEATILLNVSENGWYGRSFAAEQLVQMARLRAIELARPMLRVDNAGPSVAIDHRGEVVAVTRPFEKTVLSVSIQGRRGVTPYARLGNWPVLGLVLSVIGIFTLSVYRRSRGNQTA